MIVVSELQTINNATGGTISLDGNLDQALEGSAEALAEALTGISNFAGDITYTSDPATASDLLSVAGLTSSDTVSAANLTQITGEAADLKLAFATFSSDPSEVLTSLVIEGVADASDITDLKAEQKVNAINGESISDINGSVSEINAAVSALGEEGVPDEFDSEISQSTAAATDIITLNDDNGSGSIDASSLEAITGTPTNILAALALVTPPTSGLVATISGDVQAAKVNLLDDESYIDSFNANAEGLAMTSISGTAEAVYDALVAIGGNDPASFSATITGVATTDQISYIHTAIGDGNLDGSGLTKITGSSTAVIAQLANINDKPGADSLAIELTGSSTGSNIITLAGHSYVSGVDGSVCQP